MRHVVTVVAGHCVARWAPLAFRCFIQISVRGYAMTETSISIDEELLAEARKIAGTTTNQAAIDHALRDLVEREAAAVAFDRIVERELGDTKVTLEF
ncbi:hypothetical protein GCM10007979_34010 [Nocardioides albus]|nr:hypothetical protein GCM10007979_34010 [Nocardioides albus]